MRPALLALLVALFPLAASGAASGQEPGIPSAVAAFDPALLPPRVLFDEPGDGAIWARGSTYKASFATAGFTFIPLFGSRAPRNFPLTFSLESARVGEADLPFARLVRPAREGHSVLFDRGILLERYELSPEGVEQIFVLESAAGAGDLVVRMAVETDLVFAGGTEGLDFAADGYGFVRYGKAVAIDATGRRTEVQGAYSDGSIELRLPASSLEEQVFPLAIDPLVVNFPAIFSVVSSATLDDLRADAAYDWTTDTYFIVYEDVVSASDSDVYGVHYDSALSLFAPYVFVVVDATTARWANPKVANNGNWNQHLVVAEVGTAPNRDVRSRIVAAGSGTAGTPLIVDQGVAGEAFSPDVGGDSRVTAIGTPSYLVVWEQASTSPSGAQSDIYGRFVSPSGTLFSAAIPLATGSQADSNPSVSKSNGAPPAATQDWTVVWERIVGPVDADIYGARVHWDGTVTSPAFPIDTSLANHRDPAVSSPTDDVGGSRMVLVAYEVAAGMVAPNGIIEGKILSGTAVVASANLSAIALSPTNPLGFPLAHADPSVDSDGCRFAVAWSRQDPMDLNDYDTFVSTFHFVNGAIAATEASVTLEASPTLERRPEIVANSSGGMVGPRYLVVWDQVSTFFANYNIRAALYDGHTGAGGHATVATGCGGVNLVPSGTPALGGFVSYTLTGGTGTPLVILSLPSIPPNVLCPLGCAIGVTLPAISFVFAEVYSTAIPCDPALLGGQVAAQGFLLGDPNGCFISSLAVTTSPTIVTTVE
jgi:hypothetical protein